MKRTEEFWDKVSKLSRHEEKLGSTAKKTVDIAKQYVAKDSVVLDIGCGPGDLTMEIAKEVMSVHAIDTSSGMIAIAKDKIQAGTESVKFEQASLSIISAREEKYTAVTAFNVLQYMEDVSAVSKRVNSLLPPTGLFLSATACVGEKISLLRLLTSLLIKLGIMPKTHYFTLTQLTDLITLGGFQIIAVEKLSPLPEYFIIAKKL